MPGDIRYRDINDDGVIDVKDAVHIGFPTTPRIIYGFNGFINYKGLEFSFAFRDPDNGDSLLIRQQFLLLWGIMLCLRRFIRITGLWIIRRKDRYGPDCQQKYHGSQSTGRLYNR